MLRKGKALLALKNSNYGGSGMRTWSGKKVMVVSVIVALVAGVGVLAYFLTTLPNARYDTGYKVGLEQGKHEQLASIKGDMHKGVIPSFVGQNSNQVGYWSFEGQMRVEINSAVNLRVKFVTPNGEEVTHDNAKNYKVVSQEPKAGTVFDVTYEKDESGKEYEGLVRSTGIQEVVLNVEKITASAS